MNDFYQILDNPVWNALQTTHKNYAKGTSTIQKYPADMLQILGCENPAAAKLEEIEPWMSPGEKLFMVGELAPLPAGWNIYNKIECVQMVCEKTLFPSGSEIDIISLNEKDNEEMLALINQVQPGYFHHNTRLSGRYFGIRHDNKLIAMAGERLCMTGFTEISAVCTHPSYTGKGYARQLVAHITHTNLSEGKLPFLHFVTTNIRARKIYELLGFTERRLIPFWGLTYLNTDKPAG
ncbi:GNAT family N-acetyltransferase [Dyadobacter sp. NIV53]|uniref:GNAT family N-acetyltransferase n=1 Tax=Dyadobacter sp. NIV53 TaxID=2861765 RepID=UPI001C86D83C|nr:GNAT family N-acetyltransferase [Dyadobacter sp. NIV53]